MDGQQADETLLVVPRGRYGLTNAPLKLDMVEIHAMERRLKEVAIVTPRTGAELMSSFNEAANTVTKYMSWIKYEILTGEKEFNLAKAEVIIDKLPDEAKKLKDTGMKPNENLREALIAKDQKCSELTERLNALNAAYELLDCKARAFIRAYSAVRSLCGFKDYVPAAKINATPGMTMSQDGFMGTSKIPNNGGSNG